VSEPVSHSQEAELSLRQHVSQVSGLPTNQEFLKRLTTHPAFIAAELDTSFIQQHHASLVDAEPVAQHVLALAAVADHLLQVQEVCTSCKKVSSSVRQKSRISARLSVHLSKHLSVCLSVWLAVCLFVCLWFSRRVNIRVPSTMTSVCLSVCLYHHKQIAAQPSAVFICCKPTGCTSVFMTSQSDTCQVSFACRPRHMLSSCCLLLERC